MAQRQLVEARHALRNAEARQGVTAESDTGDNGDSEQLGMRLWHALLNRHGEEGLSAGLGQIAGRRLALGKGASTTASSASLEAGGEVDSPSTACVVPWDLGSLALSDAGVCAAHAALEVLGELPRWAVGEEAEFLRLLQETVEDLCLSGDSTSVQGSPSQVKRVPFRTCVQALQQRLRVTLHMLGHMSHALTQSQAEAAAATARAEAAEASAARLQGMLDAIGIKDLLQAQAVAEEEAEEDGRRVARRNTELKRALRDTRRRLAVLHQEVDELRNMKGQSGRISRRFGHLELARRHFVGVQPKLPGYVPKQGGPLQGFLTSDISPPVYSRLEWQGRQASRGGGGEQKQQEGRLSTAVLQVLVGGDGEEGMPSAHTSLVGRGESVSVVPCGDGVGGHLAHLAAPPLLPPAPGQTRAPAGGDEAGSATGHEDDGDSEGEPAVAHAGAEAESLPPQAWSAASTAIASAVPGEGAGGRQSGMSGTAHDTAGAALTDIWHTMSYSAVDVAEGSGRGQSSAQFFPEDLHRVRSAAEVSAAGQQGVWLLHALQASFNDALSDFDGGTSSTYKPLLAKGRAEREVFVGELVEVLLEWRGQVLHVFPHALDSWGSAQGARHSTVGGVLSLEEGSEQVMSHASAQSAKAQVPQEVPDAWSLLCWRESDSSAPTRLPRSAAGLSVHGGVRSAAALQGGAADRGALAKRFAEGMWETFGGRRLPALPRELSLGNAVKLVHEVMGAKLAHEQRELEARVKWVEWQAMSRASALASAGGPSVSGDVGARSPSPASTADGEGGTPPDAEAVHFSAGELKAAFRVTLMPLHEFFYEFLSLHYVLDEAVDSVAHSVLTSLAGAPPTPHVLLLMAALGGRVEECTWRCLIMGLTRLRQLGLAPSTTHNLSVLPTALYPPPITPPLRTWTRDFQATCPAPSEPTWEDVANYLSFGLMQAPESEPRLLRCATSLGAVDRSGKGLVPYPLAADTLQRITGRWHHSSQAMGREILPALFLAGHEVPQPASGWFAQLMHRKGGGAAPGTSTAGTIGSVDVAEVEGATLDTSAGPSPPPSTSPVPQESGQRPDTSGRKSRRRQRAEEREAAQEKLFTEVHAEQLSLMCAYAELMVICHDTAVRQVTSDARLRVSSSRAGRAGTAPTTRHKQGDSKGTAAVQP